jgi:hypothetical protein
MHRVGDISQRDLIARLSFEAVDWLVTEEARSRARDGARYVFRHRPENVVKLQEMLLGKVAEIRRAPGPSNSAWWKEFQPALASEELKLVTFAEFQTALDSDERWSGFQHAIHTVLEPLRTQGMLKDDWIQDIVEKTRGLDQRDDRKPVQPRRIAGNLEGIDVCRGPAEERLAAIPTAALTIQSRLREIHENLKTNPATAEVSGHIYYWLRDRLQPTLEFSAELTEKNKQDAANATSPIRRRFLAGQTLSRAHEPITQGTLEVLRREQEEWLASTSPRRSPLAATVLGALAVLFLLFGLGRCFRRQSVPRHLLFSANANRKPRSRTET